MRLLFSCIYEDFVTKMFMNLLNDSLMFPNTEKVITCLPRRKTKWKHMPLTTYFKQIEGVVEYLTNFIFS
jgi:hypothetical protein